MAAADGGGCLSDGFDRTSRLAHPRARADGGGGAARGCEALWQYWSDVQVTFRGIVPGYPSSLVYSAGYPSSLVSVLGILPL